MLFASQVVVPAAAFLWGYATTDVLHRTVLRQQDRLILPASLGLAGALYAPFFAAAAVLVAESRHGPDSTSAGIGYIVAVLSVIYTLISLVLHALAAIWWRRRHRQAGECTAGRLFGRSRYADRSFVFAGSLTIVVLVQLLMAGYWIAAVVAVPLTLAAVTGFTTHRPPVQDAADAAILGCNGIVIAALWLSLAAYALGISYTALLGIAFAIGLWPVIPIATLSLVIGLVLVALWDATLRPFFIVTD